MAKELIDKPDSRPQAPATDQAVAPRPDTADSARSEAVASILVCQSCAGQVVALALQGSAHEYVKISSGQQAAALLKKLGRRVVVAAILPKSSYLTRSIQLPHAGEQERVAMLRLELGAQLPVEFEKIEVGCRSLGQSKEGYQRFEAYVARRATVEQVIEQLSAVGLEPDLVLPSAAIWAELLGRASHLHVMAGGAAWGELEIASLDRDGQTVVRTIGQAADSVAFHRSLAEYIRTALSSSGADAQRPLVIGWAGNSPPLASNCRVKIQPLHPPFSGPADGPNPDEIPGVLLPMTADLLRRFGLCEALWTANLIPAALRQARSRGLLIRRALVAGGLLLLAVVFSLAALKVAVWRYESVTNQFNTKIEAIRGEGEAVGRQIEQLEAVAAARARAADLKTVLDGLYDATPSGISYNQVDLGEDGSVRLRGQGDSLSDVFLLPQKLEQMPMFHSVQLEDAGQTNKGEGSVVEFRIDARLERQAPGKGAHQP